jgi:translation initiation factor IF-3
MRYESAGTDTPSLPPLWQPLYKHAILFLLLSNASFTLKPDKTPKIRVNHQIRVPELRVIGAEGENLGVISFEEALQAAETAGLDLIEISPLASPPVAKIADYGKFQYEQNKKQKENKSKAHTVETKTIQVKIGTGEHDLELKAKQASKWLKEGHRIKIDLFLRGRSKYMEQGFLRERLDRVLKLISENYKVADGPKQSPKGLTVIVERQ